MDLSLFFVGTGGSAPSARRGLPATLLRRGGEQVLFDCGEGTQRQLVRSIGLADLDCVFVTHFHADHWLGLPGMLKSFALRERESPIAVYGPRGLKEIMRAVSFIYGKLPYELTIVELDPMEQVRRDGYLIAGVPVKHRTAVAFGYVIVEDDRPGHLDAAEAERLGVTPGPDFGRLQRGETVNGVRPEQVMGATRAGRKLMLTGDTAPCEAVRVAAHGADLLVHEATFAERDAQRAAQTLHSTARQAAEVAQEAEVKMLAITHSSGRYPGSELKEEARSVFTATEAPRDFDTIEVPFPERGVPHLLRRRENPARGTTRQGNAPGGEAANGAGDFQEPREDHEEIPRGGAAAADNVATP